MFWVTQMPSMPAEVLHNLVNVVTMHEILNMHAGANLHSAPVSPGLPGNSHT